MTLLWVDIETTGTTLPHDRLLEVAAIMTDSTPRFTELARFDGVCADPLGYHYDADGTPHLHLCDDVVREMHDRSGLTRESASASISDPELIDRFAAWIDLHIPTDTITIAGSGVAHFDIPWLTELSAHCGWIDRLTFTAFDVGHVRRFARIAGLKPCGYTPKQNKAHRAMDDIEDHLAEARAWVATMGQAAR